MQGDEQALRIEGIEGIDERWAVQPDRSLVLQDVRYDMRGGWERCGGTAKILLDDQGVNPFAGQGKVNSIHWFSRHNGGPQYLLFELDDKLVYFDGSNQSWVELKSNRYTTSQPWQRTQYAAVGNNCWILNGENDPIRFDGRTAHKAGFDGPAPSVTVEGPGEGFLWGTTYASLGLGTPAIADRQIIATQYADGSPGTAEYAYVMTEVNEFGTESPPSPLYGAVRWRIDPSSVSVGGVPGPKYFATVRVPLPSGEHVMKRRLWRTVNTYGLTLGQARTFYLAAEIDGQGSFPYVDALPDSNLGRQLVPARLGPWPKGAKYMAFYKGRAFYAGMPDNPDRVVYSEVGDPENVPVTNWIAIGNADSGAITGLHETKNALIVFKRRGIHMIMEDDGRTSPTDKAITREVGCAAPNSIRDVPGLGVVFASDDGIYRLVGSIQQGDVPVEIKRISDGLGDFWAWKVNRTAMLNAWGEVYHRDGEYWLSVPMGGVPDNKMVLVYHYIVDAWSFRPDLNAACLAETHDHRGYLFVGSNSEDDHPGVHIYSPAYTTKDGVDVAFEARSNWIDLGGVYQHFTPTRVTIRALTYGTGQLTVTTYRDRRASAINVGGQARTQEDPEFSTDTLPVWGEAVWSTTERWARASPTVYAVSIGAGDAGSVCKEFQVQVTSSSRTQMLGFSVNINPGPLIPALDSVVATGTES